MDTLGLLLVVMVTAASVQDRDGAQPLLWRLRARHRGIRLCWADGGYAGKLLAWATAVLHLAVEIVRKRPGQSTFEPLPPPTTGRLTAAEDWDPRPRTQHR